ncbi:MAG TPA: efflux RND transporter periplasmic adaptor subunit [Opitutaceae bacterium]
MRTSPETPSAAPAVPHQTTEVATDVKTTVRGRGPRARWFVATTAFAVAAALATGLVFRQRAVAQAAEVSVRASVPEVRVLTVAPGKTLQQLTLPASTEPLQRTHIQPRASGYVKRWLVDLGARVEAGQPLAEIETPDLDQDLLAAQAQLEQARANLEIARINARRAQQLLETRAVAQQEFDDREAALRSRQAELNAAQANLTRVRELTRFQQLTAPFAGVVTARNVEVGDLVSAGGAGTRGLFTLEQIDTLRVFVDVPQSQMRAISPGLTAELRLREFPGRTFSAEVVRTAGALDPVTRTLRAELRVPNPDGLLLAGAFAQVRFELPAPSDVFAVPVAAVMIRAQGPQVAVVQPDNTIRLQNVTLGRDLGTELEIVNGLQPGERVVQNPSDLLRPGTHVNVVSS